MDYDQVIMFLMAVIMVILGLYFSMKLYSFWVGYQFPETGLEIIDDKIRPLGSWKLYYLVKYKFVRISEQVYHLHVEFDFNNVPKLLKMIQDSKNQQVAQSLDMSVFNFIIDQSDQTTKKTGSSDLSEANLTREESREIDSFTKTLLNVDETVPVDQTPIAEMTDLYRFLDLLDTNISLRDRLQVKIKQRLFSMKVPLLMVDKSPEKTELKFDPNYFMNTSTYNHVVSVSVYTDRMVIVYPQATQPMIIKFE